MTERILQIFANVFNSSHFLSFSSLRISWRWAAILVLRWWDGGDTKPKAKHVIAIPCQTEPNRTEIVDEPSQTWAKCKKRHLQTFSECEYVNRDRDDEIKGKIQVASGVETVSHKILNLVSYKVACPNTLLGVRFYLVLSHSRPLTTFRIQIELGKFKLISKFNDFHLFYFNLMVACSRKRLPEIMPRRIWNDIYSIFVCVQSAHTRSLTHKEPFLHCANICRYFCWHTQHSRQIFAWAWIDGSNCLGVDYHFGFFLLLDFVATDLVPFFSSSALQNNRCILFVRPYHVQYFRCVCVCDGSVMVNLL